MIQPAELKNSKPLIWSTGTRTDVWELFSAHVGDLNRVSELLEQDPSLANRVSEYVTYYLGSGAPLKNAAARGISTS